MKKEQQSIIEVSLDTDLDLVVAYKKAMQLAEISGLNFSDQTKFATAVSEICRNALVFASKGEVKFYITKEGTNYYIEAIITDQGPGIKNLEDLLNTIDKQPEGQRSGIFNCKRLSHAFDMESSEEKGTCVRIGRRLPAHHPPVNNSILADWRRHFSQLTPVSPYEELKKQNHLLLATLEELKTKTIQSQEQIEKIQVLNNELAHNYKKIKQLSDNYAAQNDLLQKRNEELDKFAHIVSHDLKSPIQNLQGLVELIELGRIQDQAQVISIFKGQLQKMAGLIESILAYSRAGHQEIEKTKVDLNIILSDIISTLPRPENFTIIIKDNFPVLFTEEVLIYQIFTNLLSNAIKYNDKPKGQINIGFARDEHEHMYFFVEDNGPGIPASERDRVFKMFAVLQKVEGVNSTGIGLSIVKKIIDTKGGKIWIQDSTNFQSGSMFCFTWPAEWAT